LISVKLKRYQTIHQFIDLIEAYKIFKGLQFAYTIEFNVHPNYLIETDDSHLIEWIKANCETNKIHRNEDR